MHDRQQKILKDTENLLRVIRASPTGFSPMSEQYQTFSEAAERAEMLSGLEVREYLKDVRDTAIGLWASRQKMVKDPGHIIASGNNSATFAHLNNLWDKRLDVFRHDLGVN